MTYLLNCSSCSCRRSCRRLDVSARYGPRNTPAAVTKGTIITTMISRSECPRAITLPPDFLAALVWRNHARALLISWWALVDSKHGPRPFLGCISSTLWLPRQIYVLYG